MNCSNCGSTNVVTTTVTEWVPYGDIQQAFQATFPVMACSDCNTGWRDHRAENAIEDAREEYIASQLPQKTVEDFSQAVRDLLAEYIADNELQHEAYREALLLLAAEL